MRTEFASVYLIALAALCISPAGCGSESPSGNTPAGQAGHYQGDGHDHTTDEIGHFEGDGHDHDDESSHVYPTEGPHGGHLIELGNEEYHAELLHDEGTHTVTIHLLDGPAKQIVAVPLAEITLQLFQDGQFVKYDLKAVQGPEDPAGAASRFEIVDDVLCDALRHQDELRGRIQVTLNGQPYTGTIEHRSHDAHEEHDDDHSEEGHIDH